MPRLSVNPPFQLRPLRQRHLVRGLQLALVGAVLVAASLASARAITLVSQEQRNSTSQQVQAESVLKQWLRTAPKTTSRSVVLTGQEGQPEPKAPTEINCSVYEVRGDQKNEQNVKVGVSGSTHGDITMFQLQLQSNWQGFAAFVNGYSVIHLYDEKTGTAHTTHGHVMGGGQAFLQLLLPATDEVTENGVYVTCVPKFADTIPSQPLE